MIKVLKILLAILVVTAILVFAAAKLLINEQSIKQQVQDLARQHTNGSLSINGSLGLSVFPRLGLSLGQLSYQLDGESSTMAELQQLQLGVGLLPLLNGRLEIDDVKLVGLSLKLLRDQQGQGNWEKVAKADPESELPPSSPRSAAIDNQEEPPLNDEQPLALSVARLSVVNTNILLNDLQSKASYSLQDFSITGSDINFEGTPFPLSLAFELVLDEPALTTNAQLDTLASLNLETQRYQFNQLVLSLSVLGEPTNNKKLLTNIGMNADIDIDKEMAKLKGLTLVIEDIALSSELSASNWSEDINIETQLAVETFNPSKLLAKLDLPTPELQNPDSLTRLSFNVDISYRGNQASLDNIDITLDKSHIQGNLSLLDIEKQKIKTAFAIDLINLDDYLPPAAPEPPPDNKKTVNNPGHTKAATSAVEETLLPVDTLKKLDYDARLTIGQLQASGLVFTEVDIKSTADTGLVKLNNFSAKLYEGTLKALGQINVRQAIPRLSFQQTLTGVNIKPALLALSEIDTVNGRANLNSKLTTYGNTADSWLRGLNGPVNFNIKQLLVKDINLEHMVCQAIALADGKSMPETTDNTTAIETINGNLLFQNGVLLAQSIKGDMKTLNLKGDGKINPLAETLDIHLGLRVAGDQVNKDSACRANSSYRDVYWPVRCKGSFEDEPARLCDVDKKEVAKISADIAADKLKEKGQKKINKYLEKLFN